MAGKKSKKIPDGEIRTIDTKLGYNPRGITSARNKKTKSESDK